MISEQYSLIAQLVEHSTVNRVVTGSSPVRGAIWRGVRVGRRSTIGNRVGATSVSRVRIPLSAIVRPVGQGVKTPPFHGGNRGSNPLRVIALLLKHQGMRIPKVRRRISFVSNCYAVSNEVRVSPCHYFHLKKRLILTTVLC